MFLYHSSILTLFYSENHNYDLIWPRFVTLADQKFWPRLILGWPTLAANVVFSLLYRVSCLVASTFTSLYVGLFASRVVDNLLNVILLLFCIWTVLVTRTPRSCSCIVEFLLFDSSSNFRSSNSSCNLAILLRGLSFECFKSSATMETDHTAVWPCTCARREWRSDPCFGKWNLNISCTYFQSVYFSCIMFCLISVIL